MGYAFVSSIVMPVDDVHFVTGPAFIYFKIVQHTGDFRDTISL